MNAYSFTSGANYCVYPATMTRFSGGGAGTMKDIIASDSSAAPEIEDEDGALGSEPGSIRLFDLFLRVDLGSPIPEMEPINAVAPNAPRSNGLRDRVIGAATAKNDIFAITINGDAIGVIVAVDLERDAPEWKVMGRNGMFTGSFIITL